MSEPAGVPPGRVGERRPPAHGERTRELIVRTALRLFAERGYERTTMRAIADAAGLSVSNAYYYFRSKDHLVQEFYADIQHRHREEAAEALSRTGFVDRLRGVLHAGVTVMAPYHGFAGSFVGVAINPRSPSSPFSDASAAAREAAIGLFRDVVEGAKPAVDRQVRADLPELLWLAYLGLTLYWVHDMSYEQDRTRRLIDLATPFVGRLIRISRLPGMRPITTDLLWLVRKVRS
ncbi:TetR family transcriptional regulator [Phytohabitans sp. ZYX-F-186]|uniref:TetR family transcriptional regulator n=1 Tax=Phytohabitans maris TaxID=3071409 RepID=A0ABU0ZU79_9ACTN|nr:TetR family transcriptional regulator [Phytohabitans sp. ZYX-F-186]MDQ7909502.1 TetR family transcriptional regulator [Phytohabitans sp. ZYX-F-186]